MFVLRSTYDSLSRRHTKTVLELLLLKGQWNDLVNRLNAKGGESFLKQESNQFSPGQIRTLIKLCHPDRHDGSKEANDITAKLLKMK